MSIYETDHNQWVKMLYESYNNQTLPSEDKKTTNNIMLEIEYVEPIVYRCCSFDFKIRWLEYLPPLITRQKAFIGSIKLLPE